jgi:hypothetical protein
MSLTKFSFARNILLYLSLAQCYRLKDEFPFCLGVPYGKLPLDSSQLLLDSSQLLRPVFTTRPSPPFIHIPSDPAQSMPSSSQRHSPKDALHPHHSLHHHHHHHHQLTPQQQQQQQARQQQHYQRGRSMSPNPRALAQSVASTRQSSGRQRTGGGGVIIGPAPGQYAAAAAFPPMELYGTGGTGGAFYPVYPGLPSPGANHPRHAVIGW